MSKGLVIAILKTVGAMATTLVLNDVLWSRVFMPWIEQD